jgi:hypothetical protein
MTQNIFVQMIKEPVEFSKETIYSIDKVAIFERITRSRHLNLHPERLNPDYLIDNTVKSQPSIWRKMIHEITEAIALFLLILMRWFDLMRTDTNDLAVERVNDWFWEWLSRECPINE